MIRTKFHRHGGLEGRRQHERDALLLYSTCVYARPSGSLPLSCHSLIRIWYI